MGSLQLDCCNSTIIFRSDDNFAGIGAIRFSIRGALPATLTLSTLCVLLYSSSIFSFEIKEKIPHRAKRYGIPNLVPLN